MDVECFGDQVTHKGFVRVESRIVGFARSHEIVADWVERYCAAHEAFMRRACSSSSPE